MLVYTTTRPRCRGSSTTAGSGLVGCSPGLTAGGLAGTNDSTRRPRPSAGASISRYCLNGTVTRPPRALSVRKAASGSRVYAFSSAANRNPSSSGAVFTPTSLPGSRPAPSAYSSSLYRSRAAAAFGPSPITTPPPRFRWASSRATTAWVILDPGRSHRNTQSYPVRSDAAASANSFRLTVRGRAGLGNACFPRGGSRAVCRYSVACWNLSLLGLPFTSRQGSASRTSNASERVSSAGSPSASVSRTWIRCGPASRKRFAPSSTNATDACRPLSTTSITRDSTGTGVALSPAPGRSTSNSTRTDCLSALPKFCTCTSTAVGESTSGSGSARATLATVRLSRSSPAASTMATSAFGNSRGQ